MQILQILFAALIFLNLAGPLPNPNKKRPFVRLDREPNSRAGSAAEEFHRMTCKEVLQEISNYLDEEVIAELRRQIEEHLRACHNCTVLVNTTRQTLTLVTVYYVLEMPESVFRKLMDRLARHLQ